MTASDTICNPSIHRIYGEACPCHRECSTCGARIGEVCRTITGYGTRFHAERRKVQWGDPANREAWNSRI